jgi:integrase
MGIYKDKKSGQYGIRVNYFGKDRRKIIGYNREAAELALAETMKEIKEAKLSGQGWDGFQKLQKARKPKIFSEAWQDFMDERENKKASTIESYESIYRAHLESEFGKDPIVNITESQIRKFQVRLDKKLTASRVNTIMQPLRSVLAQDFRAGDIPRDPSLAVKRLEEERTEISPLSEVELELVFNKIDPHYKQLFVCLAYTGARPNELLALRWSDIDWTTKQIKITKGRVRGHEDKPKTKSSKRDVPMLEQTEKALLELKDRKLKSTVGYIFTDKNGQPITKHLDRIWARGLSKAGLDHRPSYQLRHTFATQCILKGLPLPFIAKLLGHTTIDTLVRHYAGWIEGSTTEYENQLREKFKPNLVALPTPKKNDMADKWAVGPNSENKLKAARYTATEF